jgi:hypothetical protein
MVLRAGDAGLCIGTLTGAGSWMIPAAARPAVPAVSEASALSILSRGRGEAANNGLATVRDRQVRAVQDRFNMRRSAHEWFALSAGKLPGEPRLRAVGDRRGDPPSQSSPICRLLLQV